MYIELFGSCIKKMFAYSSKFMLLGRRFLLDGILLTPLALGTGREPCDPWLREGAGRPPRPVEDGVTPSTAKFSRTICHAPNLPLSFAAPPDDSSVSGTAMTPPKPI